MAEFVIVATVFFMIIFGIIEFGRLLYTHNALTDAARRGARYAVLHQEADIACVKNVVVYGEKNLDASCSPLGSPLINGLEVENVVVIYEGADDDDDPNTPATNYGMNLGTATVSIQNFTFSLAIPLFQQTLNMPAYTTTLTAESAGTDPEDIPADT